MKLWTISVFCFDSLSQDIFPSYQQWRFEVAKEREIFGQKLLLVIRRVVLMHKDTPLQVTEQVLTGYDIDLPNIDLPDIVLP